MILRCGSCGAYLTLTKKEWRELEKCPKCGKNPYGGPYASKVRKSKR